MKLPLAVLLLSALLAPGQVERPQTLGDVRTIYVDTFGEGEWAMLIRDKIVNRLIASRTFDIVDTPENADAILTGSATEVITKVKADATVVVRLVGKSKRVLWISEAKNSPYAGSASSSVADRIVKDLLRAFSPPPPKKRK